MIDSSRDFRKITILKDSSYFLSKNNLLCSFCDKKATKITTFDKKGFGEIFSYSRLYLFCENCFMDFLETMNIIGKTDKEILDILYLKYKKIFLARKYILTTLGGIKIIEKENKITKHVLNGFIGENLMKEYLYLLGWEIIIFKDMFYYDNLYSEFRLKKDYFKFFTKEQIENLNKISFDFIGIKNDKLFIFEVKTTQKEDVSGILSKAMNFQQRENCFKCKELGFNLIFVFLKISDEGIDKILFCDLDNVEINGKTIRPKVV